MTWRKREIEAMKQALEALENLFGIPDKWTGEGGGDVAVWRLGGSYRAQQAITALKEALAQPEQEPVIFYRCNGCGHAYEQVHPTSCDCMEAGGFDRVEYYTTPPAAQRQWVGLVDTDIGDEYVRFEIQGGFNRFEYAVRAIEAKLKEKNTP